MLTFKVNMKPNGFDTLIKELDAFPKYLEKKTDELVERLAKFGVTVANVYYAQATYAGTNDVTVEWLSDEVGKAQIKATGTTVLFIEFGTGTKMPDAEEERADIVSGDVLRHGEYGKKRGGNKRGWYYPLENGMGSNPPLGTEYSSKLGGTIHTYGNPANACMYLTKKEIEENFYSIAKEVFGR